MTGVQTAAARELYEGAEGTIERLAKAMKINPDELAIIAVAGDWQVSTEAGQSLLDVNPLRSLLGRLTGEIETIGNQDPGEGGYDKGRIDAIGALTRTVEKIQALALVDTNRLEATNRRNERIGDVLKRIDRRILHLAKEFAKELGKKKPDNG